MLIRSRTLWAAVYHAGGHTQPPGPRAIGLFYSPDERDEAHTREARAPQQQDFQSSQQRVAPQDPPEETHCKLINRVDIDSDNQATHPEVRKTTRQAQGRCLGSEGIRLLACYAQMNDRARLHHLAD